jgi:hypothetical protein
LRRPLEPKEGALIDGEQITADLLDAPRDAEAMQRAEDM